MDSIKAEIFTKVRDTEGDAPMSFVPWQSIQLSPPPSLTLCERLREVSEYPDKARPWQFLQLESLKSVSPLWLKKSVPSLATRRELVISGGDMANRFPL